MSEDQSKEQVVANPSDLIEPHDIPADAPIGTKPSAKLPYPGFGQAILLILLLVVLQILFSIPFMVAGQSPNPMTFAIPTLLGTVIVVAYGFKKSGALFREVLPFSTISLSLLPLLLLTVLGLFILLLEFESLLEWILPVPDSFEKLVGNVLGGRLSVWQSFIAVAIVAPLTEELLFRGLILQGFLRRYGSKKAIIASALLFALMHGNPWQFAIGVVMGIFLAWCFIKTHSLIPCLFAHCVNNTFGFALYLLQLKFPASQAGAMKGAAGQHFWLIATGLLFAASGIYLMKRLFDNTNAYSVNVGGVEKCSDGDLHAPQ
jgi:uncharacterized protein